MTEITVSLLAVALGLSGRAVQKRVRRLGAPAQKSGSAQKLIFELADLPADM